MAEPTSPDSSAEGSGELPEDLTEMTLLADLYRLDRGLFSGADERAALIASALESSSALRTHGGYSRGAAELESIHARLTALRSR